MRTSSRLFNVQGKLAPALSYVCGQAGSFDSVSVKAGGLNPSCRMRTGFPKSAAMRCAILLGELLWFAGYGSKLGWRDTAFGCRFIGRGYFQNDVLLSGLGPKDEGEGQTGRRQCGRRVVAGRNVSFLIGAQY